METNRQQSCACLFHPYLNLTLDFTSNEIDKLDNALRCGSSHNPSGKLPIMEIQNIPVQKFGAYIRYAHKTPAQKDLERVLSSLPKCKDLSTDIISYIATVIYVNRQDFLKEQNLLDDGDDYVIVELPRVPATKEAPGIAAAAAAAAITPPLPQVNRDNNSSDNNSSEVWV